jgi:hypothetical protein
MCAPERTRADQVGVLLDGGLHDLLGGLVQPGVDDLVTGVAEGPRHDLGAPVVPVQSRLAHDDAEPRFEPVEIMGKQAIRDVTLTTRPASIPRTTRFHAQP